jgi:hypothetical protein
LRSIIFHSLLGKCVCCDGTSQRPFDPHGHRAAEWIQLALCPNRSPGQRVQSEEHYKYSHLQRDSDRYALSRRFLLLWIFSLWWLRLMQYVILSPVSRLGQESQILPAFLISLDLASCRKSIEQWKRMLPTNMDELAFFDGTPNS